MHCFKLSLSCGMCADASGFGQSATAALVESTPNNDRRKSVGHALFGSPHSSAWIAHLWLRPRMLHMEKGNQSQM